MSIAITDDHRSLAETVRSFADKRDLRGAARERLESSDDTLPDFWGELAELGWLGLHLPEEVGGSGYGIEELVIVVEELARAVAPGPFVPTVIASAVIAGAGDDDLRSPPHLRRSAGPESRPARRGGSRPSGTVPPAARPGSRPAA